MAYYPQNATGLNYKSYPAGPTSTPTQITSGGSSNTKGSWVELAPSLPFTCNEVLIMVTRTEAASGKKYLLDIGVGAAGSETVVVPNLLDDAHNSTLGGSSFCGLAFFRLPLGIASGSRIAARCQCSTASSVMFVAMTFIAAGGVTGINSFVNYGANTGTSGGVTIDPGAIVDTKGAYSELTASTSAVAQVLMLSASIRGNSTPVSATWCVDIATGASGSESVLIPDLRLGIGLNSSVPTPIVPASQTLLTYIPAGTRIAVRASSSENDSTDRLIDVALIAGTAPAESSGGEHSVVFA